MTVRRTFPSTLKTAAFGLLALGVAACSTPDVAQPQCPDVVIPSDGSKLTRFKPGPGRAIIDVLFEATVTEYAQACEYNTDDTGAGEVTVYIAPLIETERGPADQQGQATYEYFLAVIDSNKKVMEKARFPVTISFLQNMSRVRWQLKEPNVITIPLAAGQNGADFQVFIGLQLTRAELEYQRSTR